MVLEGVAVYLITEQLKDILKEGLNILTHKEPCRCIRRHITKLEIIAYMYILYYIMNIVGLNIT